MQRQRGEGGREGEGGDGEIGRVQMASTHNTRGRGYGGEDARGGGKGGREGGREGGRKGGRQTEGEGDIGQERRRK